MILSEEDGRGDRTAALYHSFTCSPSTRQRVRLQPVQVVPAAAENGHGDDLGCGRVEGRRESAQGWGRRAETAMAAVSRSLAHLRGVVFMLLLHPLNDLVQQACAALDHQQELLVLLDLFWEK